MSKEAIAKSPSGRTKRTPIGVRNRLTVTGKEDGYFYRVVNDSDDRVQQFLDAGYEFVPAKDVKVGDKRVEQTSPEGGHSHMSVGGGTKAFVLRIKQEWKDEDDAAKMRQVDELEGTMRQDALNGNYGNITLSRD